MSPSELRTLKKSSNRKIRGWLNFGVFSQDKMTSRMDRAEVKKCKFRMNLCTRLLEFDFGIG
jgi:hypothetical protein